MVEKIIKKYESRGDRIEIELHNDKVIFSYTGIDSEAGHIDNAFGSWPVEEYKAAIDELERTYHCCLGKEGNKMKMIRGFRRFVIDGKPGGYNFIDIDFRGSGSNNSASIWGLPWEVEELKIK